MATVARTPPLSGVRARLREVPPNVWTALAMVALIAISLIIRTVALDGQFWIDEGLSVGIANHPIHSIPGILRQDGSPPLYYVLLHIWMSIFGRSEADTHSLSLLFATLAIPAGLWAGWSLWGRRAGLIVATLIALNPFLTSYGQETRMYALMALFSVLAAACYVHAFVYRRRGYLIPFAVLQALMLYTHSWGVMFGFGAVLGVLFLWRRAPKPERRPLIRDGLLAFVGAGLLWLPWVPTVLYQVQHTAAPWDKAPRFGAPLQVSRVVFGGDRAFVVLAIAVGIALAALVQRRRAGERDPQSTRVFDSAWVLFIVPLAGLIFAWLVSQVSPAWVPRYFAAVVGPMFLLGGLSLSRLGKLGLVLLAVASILYLNPKPYTSIIKSDMKDIATDVRPQLKPGDLVVVGQPEQLPLAWYYLGGRYRYASLLGPTNDPRYWDWRDTLKRWHYTRTDPTARKVLASLKPGQHLLFIRPVTEGDNNWSAPWTRLVRRRSAQWGQIFSSDPLLRKDGYAPLFYRGATTVGNSAVLYTRVAQPARTPRKTQ